MFWRRRRSEDDFRDELHAHLQLETDDRMVQGLSEQEARAAARRDFGSIALTRERHYERGRVLWFDDLRRDVRHSVALFRRSPGFTAAVILTLALGIGLNTAMFSFVNALLLRPLPVPASERLVSIHTSDFSGPPLGVTSYPDYLDFRDGSRDLFSGVAGYTLELMNLSGGGVSDRVQAHHVTRNYFEVVGVGVARGREFGADDGGGVVVSHGLWQRLWGGRDEALGRTVLVNGKPRVVIGVAPREFTGLLRGLPADLWLPIEPQPELAERLTRRDSRWLMVVGRLAHADGLPQAQAALSSIAAQLHRAYPREWSDLRSAGRRVTLLPANQSMLFVDRDDVVQFMTALMAVVGIVLLLACVNVANLALARATVRSREMAIRLSVGAGRARVVRQLFTESLLLSILAGLGGAVVAFAATTMLVRMLPPLPLRISLDLSPDSRVLAFTIGVSVVTGVLFALLPALRMTRPDLTTALKGGPLGGDHRARLGSLRTGLVAVQVALSVILVVGAGLSVRSLMHAGAVDVGFQPRNVVIATVSAGQQGYDQRRASLLFGQLIERIEALPSVRSAALASIVPLGFSGQRTRVALQDYTPRDGEDMEINFNVVGPRYFETMRIPVVQGREFNGTDRDGAPGAAIVNEAFIRRYWPDGVALGKQIQRRGVPFTVVGVAAGGKYRSLSEAPLPYFYLALEQNPDSDVTLHVRTDGPSAATAGAIRAVVGELDPDLPLTDVRTLEDHLGLVMMPLQTAARLLGAFGALALGLAVVGIYSVIAFSVSQRTREVGIRLALGASIGNVLALVLRQGVVVIGAGLLAGAAAAAVLTRLAASLFFGVSPTDPRTFAGAIGVLAVAGLIAALIPAFRAARIRPSEALRH
jgi:macrolide transport system ATP-binding/permease protein